jgi:transposase InsO family protein
LDFIGPLPNTAGGHNAILVFVDRLTKMTHLVATNTSIDAEGVADLFIATVFRAHGLPKELISDRDTRFTSEFWRAFHAVIQTWLCMSSAYHPQSDGQTERLNRVVEEVLHLPLTEFAINNSHQASINTTPFRLNQYFDPRIPPTVGIAVAPHERTAMDEYQRAQYGNRDIAEWKSRTPRAVDYAQTMKDRLESAVS